VFKTVLASLVGLLNQANNRNLCLTSNASSERSSPEIDLNRIQKTNPLNL